MGEEVVWRDNNVLWGMNYYGYMIDENTVTKEMINFLRKAMRQVKPDRPFRGPSEFKEGDFKYIDESKGFVENFLGLERIYFQDEKIYELRYHGGFIR